MHFFCEWCLHAKKESTCLQTVRTRRRKHLDSFQGEVAGLFGLSSLLPRAGPLRNFSLRFAACGSPAR